MQLTQVHAGAATSLPAVMDGPGGVEEPVPAVPGSEVRKFNIHKEHSVLKFYNKSIYV